MGWTMDDENGGERLKDCAKTQAARWLQQGNADKLTAFAQSAEETTYRCNMCLFDNAARTRAPCSRNRNYKSPQDFTLSREKLT
jgi:hypothetical protein